MTRKVLTIAVAFIMCVTMLTPLESFAAAEQAEGGPAFAQQDPLMRQDLAALYEAGKLTLSEEMAQKVTVKKNENGGGILLEGEKQAFADGRILIADEFDFADRTVGKVTVDGLGDRGLQADAEVCLDDQQAPAVSVRMKNQMGKRGWSITRPITVDVRDQGISSKHRVSLRIVDNSDKKPTKKITVLLRSLEFMESSLPVLYFNIDETQGTIGEMNADENHDTECYGNVTVQVPDGYRSEYTDKEQKTQTLELEYIRGRGNSTWWTDKKPYKVKLDKKADLFGMGANKHWVLLANRYDNSLMRNKMTYWLGDQLGMEFTPQSVPVEVVMNGDYYGCYYLSEQIRVGESRVEIDDLENGKDKEATEEPVITGGYLLSMEPYDEESGEDNAFTTERGVWFFLEHPAFEDYRNEAQRNYIKNYMQATENAIFGTDYKDASGKSYKDYLDVPAAIDYFWIQSLSMNGDAYTTGSTYLYKKRDGKLFWGPLWDFDYVAWGDLEYESYSVEGFNGSMGWFERLLTDPDFSAQVKARWPLIKEKMGEITRPGGLLDQYYEELKVAKRYDMEKWGPYGENSSYSYAVTKAAATEEASPTRSYEDEVAQLRGWIDARVNWVDANLEQIVLRDCKVRFKIGKKTVKAAAYHAGDTLGTLPKAPKKKGYKFSGWYWAGSKVTSATSVEDDMTIKAVYVKKGREVKPKHIFLSQYRQMVSKEDESMYLGYTVTPKNADYSDLIWTSSDPEIAAVKSDGEVVLKKAGDVTITAKIKNGPKASCRLRIVNTYQQLKYQKSFQLSKKTLKLKKGQSAQIRVNTKPEYCERDTIMWISGNSKIAAVNSYGVVTTKKKGKVDIFAVDTSEDTIRKCRVIVK